MGNHEKSIQVSSVCMQAHADHFYVVLSPSSCISFANDI